MKMKKTLAVLSCATMIAAAALPLAACGKEEKKSGYASLGTCQINVADYVKEYDASKDVKSVAAASVTAVNGGFKNVVYTDGVLVGVDSDNKYSAYANGKTLFTNSTYVPTPITKYALSVGELKFLAVQTGADVETEDATMGTTTTATPIDVYGGDGTKLLSTKHYVVEGEFSSDEMDFTVTPVDKFVNDKRVELLMFVEQKPDDTAGTTAYFEYDEIEGTYKAVAASDVKDYPSGDNAGATVQLIKSKKIYDDDENVVEGDIAKYSVGETPDGKLNFYKDGEKTGTVDLKYGEEIGYVGNYFYYSTKTAAKEGEGNLVYVEDGEYSYVNYTVHKYDIVNNKETTAVYDKYIERVTPIYNYTTKAYDAATVITCDIVDGVMQGKKYYNAYITNADLKVAYDVTHLAEYRLSVENMAKVGDNFVSVSSGAYVLNSDLEIVAIGGAYYGNEQLLSTWSSNSNSVFVGLDGKVKIEPKYYTGSGVFYGGKMMVYDEKHKAYLMDKTGNAVALPEDDEENGISYNFYVGNGLYTKTTVGATKTTMELYNFAGTSLVSTEYTLEELGENDVYEAIGIKEDAEGKPAYAVVYKSGKYDVYKF